MDKLKHYPTAKQLVAAKGQLTPDPDFQEPYSCAVCKRCWLNAETRKCLYGGPFTGYQKATEQA